MIPISLTIEGFYSYREAQTIEFDELTSNQLFGIFGAVGSGKSAILEAMTFVVFRDSDRLNRTDSRAYNMMNLKSDRTYIDFICWAGKDMREKYRFMYEAKRKQKTDDIGQPIYRTFHFSNNDWQPVEDAKPAEIIGMEYAHFCQTTIIPQGKFREFIELKPTQRASMLQELFHLDQFDLSEQNKQLLNKARAENSRLKGVLEQLASYSAQKAEELLAQEKEAKQQLAQLQDAFDTASQKLQEEQAIMQLQQEKKSYEQQQAQLAGQDPQFKKRAQKLEDYQKAYMHFDERLRQLQQLQAQCHTQAQKQQQLQQELHKAIAVENEALASYQKAQEAYQGRAVKQQQTEDFRQIIQMKQAMITADKVNQGLQNAEKQLADTQGLWAKKAEALNLQEERLEALRKGQSDMALLYRLSAWFNQNSQYAQQVMQALQKVKEGQQGLAGLKEQLAELWKSLPELPQEIPNKEEAIRELIATIQQNIATAQKQLISLKAKEELHQFANQLEEGHACPLCGSEHHPSPASNFNHDAVAKMDQALKTAQQQLAKFEKVQQAQMALKNKEALLLTQQKEYEAQWQDLQLQEAKHQKDFPEGNYAKGDQAKVKDELSQQEAKKQEIVDLEASLKADKQALSVLQERKEAQQLAVTEGRQQSRVVEAQIQMLRKQVKVFEEAHIAKYLQNTIEVLESNLLKGQQQLATIESVYEEAQLALQQAQQQKSQLSGVYQASEESLKNLKQSTERYQIETHEKVVAQGFDGLESIQKILASPIDAEAEKTAIEDFKKQTQKIGQELARVALLLAGRQTSKQALQERVNHQQEASKQLADQQQILGQLAREIAVNKDKLAEKQLYQKELEALEMRLNNLRTLDALFKGKGFVRFVASIYLQNLVGAANERFFRLTKQQLSLELNQDQEFVVRDYLNGGKLRLLKTLSGGQMFQASLCLALSLAENIQTINKADKSFFFLDEGFGTLDRNALRVVFDTLKSLQQENRIVGVISHVEDLQQEIEVSLMVENNEETGSIIRKSWS